MRITRGLHNIRPGPGCALTIGNFDGVHLGHQALLGQLAELARRHAVPAAMLTFEPHPVELLAPERAPARLTRFREKMSALRAQPVDEVICARFDRSLSMMEAERFIDEVLCDRLRVRHLLVGDDFRFGHGGRGDFRTLRAAADAGRFELSRIRTVELGEQRVSSTRVRACLERGDLRGVAGLLGRRYAICGRVSHGEHLGRRIGVPTANIALRRAKAPLAGVFVVHVHGVGGRALGAVANVGRRPTVGGSAVRVEVHLLDFEGDLYGRELRVEFLARLRGEQRFDGLDALKSQIARDVGAAREALEAPGQVPSG